MAYIKKNWSKLWSKTYGQKSRSKSWSNRLRPSGAGSARAPAMAYINKVVKNLWSKTVVKTVVKPAPAARSRFRPCARSGRRLAPAMAADGRGHVWGQRGRMDSDGPLRQGDGWGGWRGAETGGDGLGLGQGVVPGDDLLAGDGRCVCLRARARVRLRVCVRACVRACARLLCACARGKRRQARGRRPNGQNQWSKSVVKRLRGQTL
jgi:hypothetical protein